ncbi:hypothetical protein B9Z45_08725 [Limnohabitans sp. 2KL-17]|uniref:DUF3306 domain-containing protein n=1 Tax=Limnohabitans sp. 2KL-17 TaxID=1100704 RepID=UPI000D3716FA|nr:DUF3306 domain-containing protein [Limnohabitans sp. 2KL-17]PUE57301.1 hypothetical protein B9Z45_08725 [Limnohabitans sp. 2KL-17]
MSDDFFSRWSRRKQGLEKGEAPQPDPVKPQATSVHAGVNGSALASAKPPATALRKTDSHTVASPADGQQQPPLPTLEDVQSLTPNSDFQTFMREGVPGEVRNAAMKKLFTDPHFNVMDGLDIYIGDYNTPDPLPAGMLEKMVGAELLNLFPKKPKNLPLPTSGAGTQENPDQSPDAVEGSPVVAQSPQSQPPSALQATPAPQASVPTEHDHSDLQLQPNHAPAGPGPGQSTG